MGSGAMICIPDLIKIVSGIQKLMEGGYIDTKTARLSRKPTFIHKDETEAKE
jgi:hypothetical protein